MILDLLNLENEKQDEVDRYNRIMDNLRKKGYHTYGPTFKEIMPLIKISNEVGFYEEETSNMNIHYQIIFEDYVITQFKDQNAGTVIKGKLLFQALTELKKISKTEYPVFLYGHEYPIVIQCNNIIGVVAPVAHHFNSEPARKSEVPQ